MCCCLVLLLVSEGCTLLQDADIHGRILWEGMAVIRPWDAIPEAVLAVEPHIFDDESIRNGELDEEQKEVLQVSWCDLKQAQHIKVNPASKDDHDASHVRAQSAFQRAVIHNPQEIQALVEVAEFMHYWSRKGCTLELETEYEP